MTPHNTGRARLSPASAGRLRDIFREDKALLARLGSKLPLDSLACAAAEMPMPRSTREVLERFLSKEAQS
jgi:hypothetical protein